MPNQNNQENMEDQKPFYDQADGKKLAKGVTSDDENLSRANAQVRETEDASLQDDTYAFDEDNTDNEEYHDADEEEVDVDSFDVDNDDDFVQ